MTCYAAKLGNCSGGISTEHYISESVLKLAGNSIQVSGFPWIPKNEHKEIGIGSLTSKILCQKHNQELSPLDDEASKFMKALKSSFDQVAEGEELTGVNFDINGEILERWFLKILVGLVYMLKKAVIPHLWVDILFNRRPFPDRSGLHIFGELGEATWEFNLIRIMLVPDKQKMIAGAKFGIGGLPFLLAFGKPEFENPKMQSFFRPSVIEFNYGSKSNQIRFLSDGFKDNGTLFLNIEGKVSLGNSDDMPISMVRKDR